MIGMSNMQHLQCPLLTECCRILSFTEVLQCAFVTEFCSVLLSTKCCSLLQLTAANHELTADAAAQVRQAQGYLNIRVVCTGDDAEVVQNLYDFTQAAMVHAATGTVVDMASWTTADYSVRYRKLVQTTRPMVLRTMGTVGLSRASTTSPYMPLLLVKLLGALRVRHCLPQSVHLRCPTDSINSMPVIVCACRSLFVHVGDCPTLCDAMQCMPNVKFRQRPNKQHSRFQ